MLNLLMFQLDLYMMKLIFTNLYQEYFLIQTLLKNDIFSSIQVYILNNLKLINGILLIY